MKLKLVGFLFGTAVALICARTAMAADLHPIVEIETDYLFGAVSNGKWIKDAAKDIQPNTKYQIYSLTAKVGEASGSAPKSVDEPCPETMEVTLSEKPEKGVIAVAGTWSALPRTVQVLDPTQKVYINAVRDFLTTQGIDQPKVKIDSILRVDLDGNGEEEVLISATNYFSKDDSVPMRSPAGTYSVVLLRRVVAGRVETQLVEGELHPKAYVRKEDSFDAPNAYKVIAVLDLDGDGKMEVVVGSRYHEGQATTIYRCDPKLIQGLLSVGCGA